MLAQDQPNDAGDEPCAENGGGVSQQGIVDAPRDHPARDLLPVVAYVAAPHLYAADDLRGIVGSGVSLDTVPIAG
ncbi:MAG: hypothetical protein PVSMB4_01040 [Ktedonobacterales bacterium]